VEVEIATMPASDYAIGKAVLVERRSDHRTAGSAVRPGRRRREERDATTGTKCARDEVRDGRRARRTTSAK
jgi:hypothetical protein